jgi:outer membrane protein OmpA-like peptidoglycan-associated protein
MHATDSFTTLCCTALLGACTHSAPAATTPVAQREEPVALAEPVAARADPAAGREAAAPLPGEPHVHPAEACTDVRVTFPSGSAELDDAGRQQLRDYADCLPEGRTHVLYVYGTTDPVGSEQDNIELARARGRVVADYLQSVGCGMDLEIHARGEMDASESPLVWPEERAATVSEAPHHH